MKPSVSVQTKQIMQNWQDCLNMVNDYRPLFRIILGNVNDTRPWTFRGSVAKAFVAKTSPLGDRWPELAQTTQKYKEKFFAGAPMMVRTGALFNSLVGTGKGSTVVMDRKSLVFGTTIEYAKYHNDANAARTKIPLRQFLSVSQEQKEAIGNLVKKYVLSSMQGKKGNINGPS